MWFSFFLSTILASGLLNMSELSEKRFSFLKVANSILLEVLGCFYVCTFLPQGFNSERETWQCRAVVIAISFYVFFVKLATTKCGLPLLVYFAFAITLLAEKEKKTTTKELWSCVYTAGHLQKNNFKKASWENITIRGKVV